MSLSAPERLDFSIYTPERGAVGCSHSRFYRYFITLAKNFTYLAMTAARNGGIKPASFVHRGRAFRRRNV